MTKRTRHFDPGWRKEELACEGCAWSGPVDRADVAIEEGFTRYGCPTCDRGLLHVLHPSREEIEQAMVDGDATAATWLGQIAGSGEPGPPHRECACLKTPDRIVAKQASPDTIGPLTQVAQSAAGERRLFQCAGCGGYWLAVGTPADPTIHWWEIRRVFTESFGPRSHE